MIETTPSISIGGPNNEYTAIGIPLSFDNAKASCQASGLELITIETLLENVDVNLFSLDFMRLVQSQ